MSPERNDLRANAEVDRALSRTRSLGSDNVCSVGIAESDSESSRDSKALAAGNRLPDHTPVRPGPRPIPATARFWSKVDRSAGPNACWIWASTRLRGYGQIALSRNGAYVQRRVLAHRMAWELTNGPIPRGLEVCHRCDNPPCVNPAHLFLGTHKDNINDAIAKGRLTGRPIKAGSQAVHAAVVERAGANHLAHQSSESLGLRKRVE